MNTSRMGIGDLVSAGALEFGDGYRTKRSEHAQTGYRIIRVADVMDDSISFEGPDFVSTEFAKAIGPKSGRPGDILLTTKGTVGRVAVMPDTDEQAVYSPQLCYFRVTDKQVLHPQYLRYWFSGKEFWDQASYRMNNTDMAAYINMADIRSLVVSLPSINDQQAIAEVLGALDDKIAANIELADIAGQLASNMFDQATASLPTVPMSAVLKPILGGTPTRANAELWGGKNLWASAKDITGAPFAVVTSTDEKITQQAVKSTKVKPLPAGSVILTARGTVGAVARLAVPASFNQSCYGFTPSEIASGLLYFSIVRAAQQAKSLAHGSVFDTITMRTFDHLHIPDFRDSATAVEDQIAPLLDMVTANVQENASLARIRDALLPQLMSGKFRIKDAEGIVAAAI